MPNIDNQMKFPVEVDPNGRAAVVDEAADGSKAVPATVVIKTEDKRSFVPIGTESPMPVKTVEVAVTKPIDRGVNVSTASTKVAGANKNRRCLSFINDSDTTIYLKRGSAAVVGEGIRLNANGGVYEVNSSFSNLYLGDFYAIHNGTGDKRLCITESE